MAKEKERNWSESAAKAFGQPEAPATAPAEKDQDDDWDKPDPWDKAWRRSWRTARPRGREDIMLDCRSSEGGRRAFGYTWLASITFEPGTITLLFGENTVTVTGRNLEQLYDALVQHRVPFIQEGNETEEALKPEDEPHIDELSIEPLEEQKRGEQ